MPFLSFYSVMHMVSQSPWTSGLHDVICQGIGDMMSLVSVSRKTEFAFRGTAAWETVRSGMCDSSSDGIYRHSVTIFICSSGGATVMRNCVASFKTEPKAIIMWQSGTLDLSDDKQGARRQSEKSVAPVVHLKVLLTKIKIDLDLLGIW